MANWDKIKEELIGLSPHADKDTMENIVSSLGLGEAGAKKTYGRYL